MNKIMYTTLCIGIFILVINGGIVLALNAGQNHVVSSENPSERHTNLWTVVDELTSIPCILLSGSFQFQVPCQLKDDVKIVTIPSNATSTGSCRTLWGEYQEIKLSWSEPSLENSSFTFDSNNSVYFGFATNWQSEFSNDTISAEEYALNAITVVYHGRGCKNVTNSIIMSYSVSDFIAFLTPASMAHTCQHVSNLFEGKMKLTVWDLKIEAFRQRDTDYFRNHIECNFTKSDIYNLISWFSFASICATLFIGVLYSCITYYHNVPCIRNVKYRFLKSF